MPYPKHLVVINKHYYFKIRVPVDLQSHFPTPLIKKSLKTADLEVAIAQLVSMEYQVARAFTLLRSGMLHSDMITKLVSEIIPSTRGKIVKTQADIPAKKLILPSNNGHEVKRLVWPQTLPG